MQLERLQVVLRPRHHWEAIDLGFRMVQTWWGPLYKLWLISFLPIISIIILCTYQMEQKNLILLIWWLKPLYDRIILYFLSRALFGEIVTIRKLWQTLPHLLFQTHLLRGLTLERFDLARSFRLPIWQLENLPKGTHSLRFMLLAQRTVNPAKNFITVCLLFEGGLSLALIGFLYFMTPVNAEIEWEQFFIYDTETTPLSIAMIQMVCYGLALGCIEPFYVAGGFALYLNRRIHLEGWDIEIAFRHLMRRYESQHNRPD